MAIIQTIWQEKKLAKRTPVTIGCISQLHCKSYKRPQF